MRRYVVGLAALGWISAGWSQSASADWPFFHKASVDYARNNAWPQPFRAADSMAVVAPFEIMKNNGWRENNTLGSILFSPEHEISDAGSRKIEWILTQAPATQRVIYVKSGENQEITNARIESVQLAVSQMVPSGPLPQILVTNLEPPTSSGVYQTLVHRAMIQTTPAPRLGAYTGLAAPSKPSIAPNAGKDGTVSSGGGGGTR